MGNPFDKIEEDGGIVVHAFSQSDFIKNLQAQEQNTPWRTGGEGFEADPSTSNGVCRALSALWVMNSANGKDHWSTLESSDETAKKEVQATVKAMQHSEKQYSKAEAAVNEKSRQMTNNKERALLMPRLKLELERAGEANREWAPNLVKERTGMGETETWNEPENASDLAELSTKVHGYSLLALFWKTGGHGVATYHDPAGGIFFMDPNYGEAYFPSADKFKHWFTTTFVNSYGDYGPVTSCEIDRFNRAQQPGRPEYARPRPGVMLPAHQTASQNILEYHTMQQKEKADKAEKSAAQPKGWTQGRRGPAPSSIPQPITQPKGWTQGRVPARGVDPGTG